jgi:hypothetical protein
MLNSETLEKKFQHSCSLFETSWIRFSSETWAILIDVVNHFLQILLANPGIKVKVKLYLCLTKYHPIKM